MAKFKNDWDQIVCSFFFAKWIPPNTPMTTPRMAATNKTGFRIMRIDAALPLFIIVGEESTIVGSGQRTATSSGRKALYVLGMIVLAIPVIDGKKRSINFLLIVMCVCVCVQMMRTWWLCLISRSNSNSLVNQVKPKVLSYPRERKCVLHGGRLLVLQLCQELSSSSVWWIVFILFVFLSFVKTQSALALSLLTAHQKLSEQNIHSEPPR